MKNILFSCWVLLLIFFYSCGSQNTNTEPTKNSYLISTTGFDSLNLGMGKAEVEALQGTTFKLKHITVDGGPYDTFNTRYKGADITIYLYESDEKTVATLYGIQSSDPSCKTITGIGVGSGKPEVIDAYENFKKYIAPVYDPYPVRSKTKSAIAVMDTIASKALIFHIINRKVSSIEVTSHYEFD